jgi:hypothetical protein
VFFLLFKRNSKEKSLRVIFFYVLYCIANEGMNFYLQSIHSQYAVLLFPLFTVVEYSFFCYFIYSILVKNSVKKAVPFIWIGFLLFAFIDYMFFSKPYEFDSITSAIEAIIVLMLCITYLISQMRGTNSLLIYSTFNFWAVIAFFIYFSGTFLLYLMTERMMDSSSFQKIYFIINISFNILKNLLLSLAMTMKVNSVNKQKTTIPELDDLFIQTNTNQAN